MDLENKVAVITGGANGIGKAIAFEFAKEGAKVVVCDIDIDNAEEVCDDLTDKGFESIPIECDVSRKGDVQSMVKNVLKTFQRIDILVCAASEDTLKPFFKTEEKEWDWVNEVNLKGGFLSAFFVGKQMAEQKKGKIIFISSIAGTVGFNYAAPYCASKAGLSGLRKELALELSEYNINVNSVVSGVLPTKILNDILQDKKNKKELLKNIPLGRIGKPEEIARAAVFLASNKSDYITGQGLVVDGGWLCQ